MKSRARPPSIKLFTLAYLAQGLVSLAHNLYNADFHRRLLKQLISPDTGAEFLPVLLATRLGIVLALASWLCMRASNSAKWIIIVLFLPSLVRAGDAWSGLWLGRPNSFFWLAASVLYLIAILLLFRPDARYWFATKGGTTKGNAQVFD